MKKELSNNQKSIFERILEMNEFADPIRVCLTCGIIFGEKEEHDLENWYIFDVEAEGIDENQEFICACLNYDPELVDAFVPLDFEYPGKQLVLDDFISGK